MKNVFLLALLSLSTTTLVAQLSEANRFYPFAFPNITNPANTGFFFREISPALFRIQSNSHLEYDGGWNYFNTDLNLDYQLPVFKRDYLGLGVDYKLRKPLSDPSYANSYKIRASYQKHFGRRVKDILSFGISIGVQDVNPSIYRVWSYQQEHGFSWGRPVGRHFYQLGLIHKMEFLLDDSSIIMANNLNLARWQHWAGFQGHGEWKLSRKISLNFLMNYQYRFYGGGGLSKHLLGATIASSYDFGPRRRQKKILLGAGIQWLGEDVKNTIPLTYNLFGGYEQDEFRIMAHFSFRYDDNNRTTNSTQISYQLGLSLAYHILRNRRQGGVPDW